MGVSGAGHKFEATFSHESPRHGPGDSQAVALAPLVGGQPNGGPCLPSGCFSPFPAWRADGFSADESKPEDVITTQNERVDSRHGKKNDGDLVGCTLMGLGPRIVQGLLEAFPLRSKTMGEVKESLLFPLPTSSTSLLRAFPDLAPLKVTWLSGICMALNSIYGCNLFCERDVNDVTGECLKLILVDVERWNSLTGVLERFDWDSFFNTRGIDYKGDEVKNAMTFCWSNIQPALPAEIGRVPLREVCTLGARHYVDNFDSFVRDAKDCSLKKAPRVMVRDSDWPEVCRGLVASGLCTMLPREEVYDTGEGLLLNGLFGVTKDEWVNGVEVFRLIMNLIPLNALCCPLQGDIETLPMWSMMNTFFLQPSEQLLISSEDVRCFFYTMSVPTAWWKYLAFNKVVPQECLPPDLAGQEVYLASKVLPMGFANSVSLAQHVHRNLALWSGSQDDDVNRAEEEIRKDRPTPVSNRSWRIYLDNYDLLEKVSGVLEDAGDGSLAPAVSALRQEYERWQVPRNMKKAVARSTQAEVQGAQVDGKLGVAYPREAKLLRYAGATLRVLSQHKVSQKQMQVVCGGLVYVATFRRQLLGTLNAVWKFIESFNHCQEHFQRLPPECKLELSRFLCCLPLAKLDFRVGLHPQVSCSDASTSGGGVCISKGTSLMGMIAAQGKLRGQVPEQRSEHRVLSIGLFDGIGALRVALDALGLSSIGHISVEKDGKGRRVVESHFADSLHYEDVKDITEEEVHSWQGRFSQASIVVIGAGPPCQGVSGLNVDRLGALKDQRSNLFQHVSRIRGIVTTTNRPRLYWITWGLSEQEGVELVEPSNGIPGEVKLWAWQDLEDVCQEGWTKVDPSRPFPTFTTSRPRASPGRRPAGVGSCDQEELDRWAADSFRFPPYQYRRCHCLINAKEEVRLPTIAEKEVMLGFPVGYTAHCLPKGQQRGVEYQDARHSLLGNSWSVPVVTWLLGQLFHPLGLCPLFTPQVVVDQMKAGNQVLLQSRLWRMPLRPLRGHCTDMSQELVNKLSHVVSIRGEDVMLNAPSQQQVKYQRLRGFVQSSAMPKRVLEANTAAERAQQRRRLGSLRSLTVQPATKARYNQAVDKFLAFLNLNKVTLPKNRDHLDALVCEYLEHLWATGAGRALASDSVAGLQDADAKLRGHLPGSWRLLKTWAINEIPNRAPPMPVHVLHALVGWALFHQHVTFAVSLILGFYGMLRTGEILGLRSHHLSTEDTHQRVVVSLGLTKGGKRQGAAESVVIGYDIAALEELEELELLSRKCQALLELDFRPAGPVVHPQLRGGGFY
eukprot:Skav224769  [mRNA]  locus=scaffold1604:630943:636934:- [translate_table: standard]